MKYMMFLTILVALAIIPGCASDGTNVHETAAPAQKFSITATPAMPAELHHARYQEWVHDRQLP